MSLNYLNVKQMDTLLELLQKFKEMIDGTLGKYTGYDYAKDLQEDGKTYHVNTFPIPNSRTNAQQRS